MGAEQLVAVRHVLADALQADRGVGDQGQAPELVVVLAQVVSGKDRCRALCGSNRVDSADRRMRAVEICGLDFDVADALLAGKPVFAGKQGGVGVGKRAPGRDQGQANKGRIHGPGLGFKLWGGSRHRRLLDEAVGSRYRAGSIGQLLRNRDSGQYQNGKAKSRDRFHESFSPDRSRLSGVRAFAYFFDRLAAVHHVSRLRW